MADDANKAFDYEGESPRLMLEVIFNRVVIFTKMKKAAMKTMNFAIRSSIF